MGRRDTVRTMEDSLGSDGFGRLRAAVQLKGASHVVSARDTFNFDRDGGIIHVGESRTYDVSTTQMSERAGAYYNYDDAGNETAAGDWHYQYDALDRLVAVRYHTRRALCL